MSDKKYKLFVSCDVANHVCDKTQYNEASLWEKIKLNIHLVYCKACRKYTQNNQKLTKAVKESEVQCLDVTSKEIIKQHITTELEKHQY
ncbi:hypothetical protein AAFP94_14565 [Flavobacteriaceae bacterium MJ-SS4]|uniref:hypothetical protein n=1 Tax=Gilvirhabdus luticola TaxID=3079858 RepID=UPI0032DE18DB